MITAQIIADSLSPQGKRLTTFVLEFPRWILAELNTHRMLSRNVASSRAIPIEKMIQMVLDNPATPVFYGKNQSGMQSSEELIGDELNNAKAAWLKARDRAVENARELAATGMHKQYVNRLIENFMYVRAIVSGTEWQNFFALRAHKDAQPEIQALAYKMLELYNSSTPKQLKAEEWHLPFDNSFDQEKLDDLEVKIYGETSPNFYCWYQQNELKKKICVARCARISYFNFEGKDDYEADIKLCDRLFGSVPRHLSPTEHVAQATDNKDFIGNFSGFKQYRYFFNDQNLSDPRVIKK